jgi:HSP20 family protein
MKNMMTGGNNRSQHQDVATFNKSSADFNSLLNYFWNYTDMPNILAENTTFADLEPKVQVTETKDAVAVTAEMPGINENDLDLKISSDGYLSISGEKKNSSQTTGKDACFSEISYGMFKRTIPLPWDLDYESAAATYNNGVLNVSIPKTQVEKQKFKKISVNTDNN